MINHPYFKYIALFISLFSWGSSASFYCYLNHIPTLQIICCAFLIGAFIIFVFSGEKVSISSIVFQIKNRSLFIILFFLNQLFYMSAFSFAPAAQVDMLNYTWPLMMVFCSLARSNSKIRPHEISGLFICLLGLCCLFYKEIFYLKFHLNNMIGYIGGLLAAISWTAYNFLPRKTERKDSDYGYDMLISGSMLLVYQLFKNQWYHPNPYELVAISTMSIFCNGLGFIGWKIAVSNLSKVKVGSLANFIPIISVVVLCSLGIEQLQLILFVSAILISSGCILLDRSIFQHIQQRFYEIRSATDSKANLKTA